MIRETEITPERALELIRTLPDDGRILRQIYGGINGLMFQFEGGQTVAWLDGKFSYWTSDRLREDWAKWKADQIESLDALP